MRTLELLILLTVSILPFVKRPVLNLLTKKQLILILGLLLIVHLSIEGGRWQMFPGYVLLLFLSWSIWKTDNATIKNRKVLKILGYGILIITLLPAWVLPNVLPVFSLPEPTGPYGVGTHNIYVKTPMDEPITTDTTDTREFMVKVWYPASETSSSKQEPYLDHANRTNFIMKYGGGLLPPASMNYLDLVKTHVYEEAPISDAKFPVLVFSHGYGSNASGYYALLSEIASHGYIILNMNHTYESLGSTFPDGTEKYFDHAYQAAQDADAMKHIGPIREAFQNDLSYNERHVIIREAAKDYNVTYMVKRWTKDMVYTLDQLETWNTEGFLKGKLDLDKIGVFGHSRGGGAAGQLALKDKRIQAAANIDGVQWGEMMDTIYTKPFLYISADWPANHEDINAHVYKNKSTDYFYETKILTAAHPNFMDIPFMVPVKSLAQTGTIDAELGIKLTNELLLNFFDTHLKHDDLAMNPESFLDKYEILQFKVYQGGNTNMASKD